MKKILEALTEPSTWAGIAVVTGAVSEQLAMGSGWYGAAVAGLMAILLRERGKGTTPPTK